jgi:hypothetical protein
MNFLLYPQISKPRNKLMFDHFYFIEWPMISLKGHEILIKQKDIELQELLGIPG